MEIEHFLLLVMFLKKYVSEIHKWPFPKINLFCQIRLCAKKRWLTYFLKSSNNCSISKRTKYLVHFSHSYIILFKWKKNIKNLGCGFASLHLNFWTQWILWRFFYFWLFFWKKCVSEIHKLPFPQISRFCAKKNMKITVFKVKQSGRFS